MFTDEQIRALQLYPLRKLNEIEKETTESIQGLSMDDILLLHDIKENDKAMVAARLIEMSEKNSSPHPFVLRKIACLMMRKKQKGRPQRSEYEYDKNGVKVAEDYGRLKAGLRFITNTYDFNNCTDIKDFLCRKHGTNSRDFDSFISKFKYEVKYSYLNEILRWHELEEDLDEKGQADLEQAKKDLWLEVEMKNNNQGLQQSLTDFISSNNKTEKS